MEPHTSSDPDRPLDPADESEIENAVHDSGSNDTMAEQAANPGDVPNLLLLGLIVEGGLVVLAVLIAWMGFYDSSQPLFNWEVDRVIWPALIWGVAGTIPLLSIIWGILYLDFGPFRTLRTTMDELLVPMFRHCSLFDIALLSIMAGVGEELFFRWCLQGGLQELLHSYDLAAAPIWAALIVALLFGFCHFINAAYFASTALIGFYMGMMMIGSGTYLAAVISHALFDFVALIVIIRLRPTDSE